MSFLVPCPECARHVRHTESACPFCAAPLVLADAQEPPLPRTRLGRAATFAFGATLVGATTLVACGGESEGKKEGGAGKGGAAGASSMGGSGNSGAQGGAAGDGGYNGVAGGVAPAYGLPPGGSPSFGGTGPVYGTPPGGMSSGGSSSGGEANAGTSGGGPVPPYGAPPRD